MLSLTHFIRQAIKRREENQRKLKVGLICLLVGCVFFGLILGTRNKRLRAEEVQLLATAKSMVSPTQGKACFAEASDEGRYSEYQCLKRCGHARLLPPEPLPHRACLVGCGGGAAAGLELGCEAVLSIDACATYARKSCASEHCKSFVEDEIPGAMKLCLSGCEEMAAIACLRSGAILGEKRSLTGSLEGHGGEL